MSFLLEVDGLKVHFPILRGVLRREVGRVRAVDGVSFGVEAGSTLGLVGESGCGKSTTARAIMRLIPATAGSVRLDGKELMGLEGSRLRAVRRGMQMVFQDPHASLNPRMTVFDTLSEPLVVHGISKQRSELEDRTRALMLKVGLDPAFMRRYPHEFSGGQRQRVGIARAIALEPKLVILDEPVSALDVSIQAQVLNLLADLQSELGLTYVFVAHDLAVVRHICREIAVMYLGRVVERAPSEQLFDDPQHPYTKALLSAVPIPDPVIERKRKRTILKGEVPSPIHPPSGCHFHPRCPVAEKRCRTELPRDVECGPDHTATCLLVKPRNAPVDASGDPDA